MHDIALKRTVYVELIRFLFATELVINKLKIMRKMNFFLDKVVRYS